MLKRTGVNMGIFENQIIISDMEDIYKRKLDWEKLNGKNILITGAYGMLASYFVFFLIYLVEYKNMNINIYVLVKDMDKVETRFCEYAKKPYFVIVTQSLVEPIDLDAPIHYIVHAASLASPQYYRIHPIEVAEPNAIGTYMLLKFAEKNPIEGFLMFSTVEIYGEIEYVENITETDYGVMDPLDIRSCYGESKRMSETWCSIFSRQKGIPTKIARIGHTYAPTMDIEHDPRVFASFMKCVMEGKDIIMHSDGSARRTFCYIADAVDAFFRILLEGTDGEAYNICNTKEFLSMQELADILVDLVPEKMLKVCIQKRDEKDLYLEKKAKRISKPVEDKLVGLGWKCHFDSQTGFARVLDYYRINQQLVKEKREP